VIEGERDSGTICLNGPSARAAMVGDMVTILAYAQVTPEEVGRHRMAPVKVDAQNRQVK
jgi:aspartate 1-decarboxylase